MYISENLKRCAYSRYRRRRYSRARALESTRAISAVTCCGFAAEQRLGFLVVVTVVLRRRRRALRSLGGAEEQLRLLRNLYGAKECKSCRSQKMLQNEPLVAIEAVGTAENEPLKVLGWFHSFFNPLLTRACSLAAGASTYARISCHLCRNVIIYEKEKTALQIEGEIQDRAKELPSFQLTSKTVHLLRFDQIHLRI